MTDLPLVDREAAPLARRRAGVAIGDLRPVRSLWVLVLVIAVGWSLWDAGVGRRAVLNPGGWPLVTKFLKAVVQPELSRSFLVTTLRATVVTVAYASVATALSVVIGIVGGIVMAETTWLRRLAVGHHRRRWGWWIVRGASSVPRGLHEAVWGLLLVNVLGRDPLVAVLAIAIPYGAITAKVYSELIDETAAQTMRALRAAGSGRVTALLYGVVPMTAKDLASYGFYRFECSLRAAVILGFIGAGGLGFQLSLSFSGLKYGEMWTIIYALLLLGTVAEWWSATLRRGASARRWRWSLVLMSALTAWSVWYVKVKPWSLWSPRTRDLTSRIARQAWPPRLPDDSWRVLLEAARDTLQMSLLAIVMAVFFAVPVAIVGSRGAIGTGPAARVVAWLARFAGLTARAVPPTVWALLVLFVVFPGSLPGAIALGLYTAGVLTRLFGEVLENVDGATRSGLRRLGAAPLPAFLYGSLPLASGRWTAYALYRWEVAARESVVVGMVGAGGLGRWLSKQTTAFDYRGMLTTVAALIVLTFAVDLVSSAVRRSLAPR